MSYLVILIKIDFFYKDKNNVMDDFELLKKTYDEDNIDLFNLYVPDYKKVLSDILINDKLDDFLQLLSEVNYLYVIHEYHNVTYGKELKSQWNWFIRNNLRSETCMIIRFLMIKHDL